MLGEDNRLGVLEIGVLRKTFVRLRRRTLQGKEVKVKVSRNRPRWPKGFRVG